MEDVWTMEGDTSLPCLLIGEVSSKCLAEGARCLGLPAGYGSSVCDVKGQYAVGVSVWNGTSKVKTANEG